MSFNKKMWCSSIFLLIGTAVIANTLIDNGDLEIASTKKNFPDRWLAVRQGGCTYSKDTNIKNGGKRCLLFDLQGKITRIDMRLKLKAGSKYRLTADVKTKNYKGASGIYLTTPSWRGGAGAIRIPQGTNDWKKYHLNFTLADKQESFYRLILYSSKNSHGKIWFDNLNLEEIIPTQTENNAFISAGLISKPPIIDGKLDDECWSGTLEATPFEKIGKYKFSTFAYEQTGVKIAYDNKNLYLGFSCRQKCLEPVRNALDDFRNDVKKHDGEMWKQDCVLIMLKTDKGDSFYEVIVNGAGTISDAVCKGPYYWTSGRNPNWESNARVAVKTANGVWSAEIAIPLSKLNLPVNSGTTFQACLGRINMSTNERSTYFPMKAGFHSPKYFGTIKLGPELPRIYDVNIGALTSGKNTFNFKASSSKNDSLKLNITTMDVASRKSFKRKSFKLKSTVKSYSANYFCLDKDYSFMQFTVGGAQGKFWNSPLYSRQNNNQKLTIQIKGKRNTNIVLNGQVMNQKINLDETVYKMSCKSGLYNVEGLDDKFALSANGFTITAQGSTNTKIMVNTTKFWPEKNKRFYIAENSIQPLHIVLHNPYKELKNSTYSLNFIVPEEFKLTGATSAYRQFTNLQVSEMTSVISNGKKYQHFKVTIPEGLPYKPYYTKMDGFTILFELPISGKVFKTRQTEFYTWSEYDNASTLENPQKISVNILPPLKGMVPKHFITQMWGGRMVNLNSFDLMKKFVHKTLVNSGFNDLQNGSLAKGIEMTSFGVLNLKSTWGKQADKFLETHPDYILVDYVGNRALKGAYNRVCSSILLENADMHKIMQDTIRKRYRKYDYINFDYEKPVFSGPLSCYCQRCLTRFKKSANIQHDELLDIKIIRQKYSKQWTVFMNKKLAILTGIIKTKVHSAGHKLTFYSGYQSSKTLTQYGVDWKLIAPNIDYALCGYRTSVEIIRNTISALGDTPLITGVIASPWHFTSRELSKQIDKAFIIKGIVLGSKGYLCFNIPQLDGRSYYAFSETAAMLSKYEDIIYFGKIKNDWLSVEGFDKDHYALFEKSGNKKRILVIYNEDIKKVLSFKVKMKGNYKVYDYFSKKYIIIKNKTFSGLVKSQDFNTYCIEEN
jgi:hypothetical protein